MGIAKGMEFITECFHFKNFPTTFKLQVGLKGTLHTTLT